MNPKETAAKTVDESVQYLIDLSHEIHADPETAFEEHHAATKVAALLAGNGFEVEVGYAELPTAIWASRGEGPLQMVICAEYDALPGIGHACGHNVIASASVGAALGLAEIADDLGLQVVLMGTPAEESGGGKIALLEAGAFSAAHAAMMVHPAPYDVLDPPVLALDWMTVQYEGREAHASAFPEEGINAADAMVVAQVGIGLLRQHLPNSARVHGIVQEAGSAANIVPAFAEASYMVRTPHFDLIEGVRDRVVACFEAGALAAGAALNIDRPTPTYAHLDHHTGLGRAYKKNAIELGRSFYGSAVPPVSTDMGNVSLEVPSLHPFIGIGSLPAVNHQPGFADAAAGPAADQAVIDGAKALAWTAIDAATDDSLRSELISKRDQAEIS